MQGMVRLIQLTRPPALIPGETSSPMTYDKVQASAWAFSTRATPECGGIASQVLRARAVAGQPQQSAACANLPAAAPCLLPQPSSSRLVRFRLPYRSAAACPTNHPYLADVQEGRTGWDTAHLERHIHPHLPLWRAVDEGHVLNHVCVCPHVHLPPLQTRT